MRVGFTSALWISLIMVALVTVTVAIPQRCEILRTICVGHTPIKVVDTGQKATSISCNLRDFDNRNTYVWYFNNGSVPRPLDVTDGTNKYGTGNSQSLTVRDITFEDEGLYYCRLENTGSVPEPTSGTCLSVYSSAQFATCGNDDSQTLQIGCSSEQKLKATTEDPSVTFNISVVHRNEQNYCHFQSIQTLTFRKSNSDFSIRCNNVTCEDRPRFNDSRSSLGPFDIALTLQEPNMNDTGLYVLTGNIRDPSTYMRVCIYKNFSLTVTDPVTTVNNEETTISPTTPTNQAPVLSDTALIIIASIISVLALLLIVLIGIGVFLCLWTFYRRKPNIYEEPKKKKRRNGFVGTDNKRDSTISFSEHESVMLTDKLNSPPQMC